MRLSCLILAFVVVVMTSCARANSNEPAKTQAKDVVTSTSLTLSPNAQKALTQLKDTSMFADPFVGIAASPSQEVVAFVTILNDENAVVAFRDLYATAKRPEGKLYGLCGLWYVDQAAFKRGVDQLRGSTTTVQKVSGCIVGTAAVGGLIRANMPGRVVLNDPNDTIDAWVKRQPQQPTNYVLDIEGGGIPFMMGEQRNNPKFAWK